MTHPSDRQWPAVLRLPYLALAVLSLRCAVSVAGPANITDGELALLPPYCQDVQAIRYGNAVDNPSPRAGHWVGVMGKHFWHMHHYCWGLIHIRRSQAPGVDATSRQGMISAAIGDYTYVIDNSPRDFVMAPEIRLRIGEAHLMLGQVWPAQEAFKAAREIKPDYWPAYTRWIDVLIRANQKGEAKALAAEGLRFSPQATELITRYRKLGGDPSTIVPAVLPTPPTSAEADAAAERPAEAASSASAAAPAASR